MNSLSFQCPHCGQATVLPATTLLPTTATCLNCRLQHYCAAPIISAVPTTSGEPAPPPVQRRAPGMNQHVGSPRQRVATPLLIAGAILVALIFALAGTSAAIIALRPSTVHDSAGVPADGGGPTSGGVPNSSHVQPLNRGPAPQQALNQALKLRKWKLVNGREVDAYMVNVTADGIILYLPDDQTTYWQPRKACEEDAREYADSLERQFDLLKQPLDLAGKIEGRDFEKWTIDNALGPPATCVGLKGKRNENLKMQAIAENGQMWGAGYRNSGEMHFLFLRFYPTGELYSYQILDHGKMIGNEPFFYKDGSLSSLYATVDAKTTAGVTYFPDGTRRTVFHNVNDQLDGEMIHFLPSGNKLGYSQWSKGAQTDRRLDPSARPGLAEAVAIRAWEKTSNLRNLWLLGEPSTLSNPCSHCQGFGFEKCQLCNGTGLAMGPNGIPRSRFDPIGTVLDPKSMRCQACLTPNHCVWCDGKGTAEAERWNLTPTDAALQLLGPE
jgi:hypothetical protein